MRLSEGFTVFGYGATLAAEAMIELPAKYGKPIRTRVPLKFEFKDGEPVLAMDFEPVLLAVEAGELEDRL